MFCEKCGNQLPDMANFCPKCGNEFVNLNQNNSIDNNEVLLEVRPTFKFSYVVLPKLLDELKIIIILIILIIFILNSMKIINNIPLYNTGTGSDITFFVPFILIWIIIPLIRFIWVISKLFLYKKQYENYVYVFYNDRVIFKDSFLNKSEKELKYKYIREITKKQTFIQKYFNIGNIELFSNAENIFLNGISMINIENVDDVYKKVKEIVNV